MFLGPQHHFQSILLWLSFLSSFLSAVRQLIVSPIIDDLIPPPFREKVLLNSTSLHHSRYLRNHFPESYYKYYIIPYLYIIFSLVCLTKQTLVLSVYI